MTSDVAEFKAGDIIEGYRVMSELGRGAASIIYLVQDPKSKQVWALKHVEKHTDKDARFLEQAEMECKIAQQLNHEAIRKITKVIKKTKNLVQVKELYLVMEFVDGKSIDIKPPKTLEVAVDVFYQTALAMAHMHGKGFVHADMKPNNVVVDNDWKVKLIDLGQSCPINTIKPRIQGTPDFIAPEQVHRRPITAKTDIYNLGAMMYFVLTKTKVPTALARGDSLMGSLDDAFVEKPKPVHEVNKNIPLKLSELVMQCVEIDADKRPADMRTVADRLNLIHGILRAEIAKRTLSSSKVGFNAMDSSAD